MLLKFSISFNKKPHGIPEIPGTELKADMFRSIVLVILLNFPLVKMLFFSK